MSPSRVTGKGQDTEKVYFAHIFDRAETRDSRPERQFRTCHDVLGNSSKYSHLRSVGLEPELYMQVKDKVLCISFPEVVKFSRTF